jgi:lipoprotein-anchoring transpeptidase ErfK/SrfK
MSVKTVLCLTGLLGSLMLAGCTTTDTKDKAEAVKPVEKAEVLTSSYSAQKDAAYTLPAIPVERIKQEFRRQIVDYATTERPGTIVVNTPERHLYYVQPGGKAVRYGISVGKAGFAWAGEAYIAWKQEWPTWHPPAEMAVRKPEIAKYVEDGMGGGLSNPLGARAMYLYNDKGQDTLFRIHGTPEWSSIGTAASSGCIRLINQDIVDLYKRVLPGRGTKVVVIQ